MKRATIALILLALAFVAGSYPPSAGQAQDPGKPSIVLIVADDMRQDQLAYMPKTRHLIAEQGIEYENAFVTTPVCCPSRASILRGQYAHNHRILDNRGGFDVFEGRGDESSTVATWLHDAGYKTLLVGKYLNNYDAEDHGQIPPGWDEWYAKLGDNTPYYGYSLSENGGVMSYGSAPEDYLTDVETEKAKIFVRQSAGDSHPFSCTWQRRGRGAR